MIKYINNNEWDWYSSEIIYGSMTIWSYDHNFTKLIYENKSGLLLKAGLDTNINWTIIKQKFKIEDNKGCQSSW